MLAEGEWSFGRKRERGKRELTGDRRAERKVEENILARLSRLKEKRKE